MIKIVSFNARGLREPLKRNTVFNHVKKYHKGGIVLLQETHTDILNEKIWKREWPGKIYFSHGKSNKSGVAILFPQHIVHTVKECITDTEGRFVILDVDINDVNYILINLYAPTKDHSADQVKVLLDIQDILSKFIDKSLICGGDFNMCLNPDLDKFGGRKEKETEYTNVLFDFIQTFELNDIWRVRNPESKRYSHRQNTKSGMVHSRIDYFLTSVHLGYSIDETKIETGILSDHSILEITIKATGDKPNRGKGFWKFNASLLSDKKYVEQIKQCISLSKNKYKDLLDHGLLWDVLKLEIRSETISYSAYKIKERNKLENDLKEKLDTLEHLLNTDGSYRDEYNIIKGEFEQIQKHKARGIMIRSKAQYIEEGERNTSYFLNLEKRNHAIKEIITLIDANGITITKANAILDEQKLFFENLYTQNCTDESKDESGEFLDDDKLVQLSLDSSVILDMDIQIEECSRALKDMKNGKSPGTDGFTADFYKFFWSDIKEIVFDSFIYAFQTGKLSIEQRRGILSLIPKAQKDLRYLKSWRPLSLLNTDYKILTKTLANRLQTVLDDLVNTDQCGYAKERFIGQNVRTIADIIEYTSLSSTSGLIALLDFEKAFDTVN